MQTIKVVNISRLFAIKVYITYFAVPLQQLPFFPLPRAMLLLSLVSVLLAFSALVGGELEYCTEQNCRLPNCYCGGKAIPGKFNKNRESCLR